MGIPDDMTDEKWATDAPPIAPGWKPGRVNYAGSAKDDGAFGWLKGQFGIFEASSDTTFGWLELSSLTHLKSGMRIALFSVPDAAATAAELAERVGDWSEIDERGITDDAWRQRAKDMYVLWRQAGMQCGPVVILPSGKSVWCALEPTVRQ